MTVQPSTRRSSQPSSGSDSNTDAGEAAPQAPTEAFAATRSGTQYKEDELSDQVTVVRGRAEDHKVRYDVVVSRALAPLPRLLTWCEPLRRDDGSIVAIKGRSAADELADAHKDLARRGLAGEVLTVRAHPSAEPTSVVRIRASR